MVYTFKKIDLEEVLVTADGMLILRHVGKSELVDEIMSECGSL